jgi:YfiH family protein
MIPHRLFRFSGGSLSYDCVLTLRAAGPMKGRTDEENRARVFSGLGIEPSRVVSLTQIHSRTVYVAQTPEDFSDWKEGDGILTENPDIVPCVTVADCMPIWLCHERAPCFGVLHSGWKGTGIIREALAAARRVWDADPAGFHVILGPHIRSCCYTVDDDRARYFSENFSPDAVCLDEARNQAGSVWPWRLSLAEANRHLCREAGIPDGHIVDTGLCTACGSEFGSNRREGSGSFTHMAALIRHVVH